VEKAKFMEKPFALAKASQQHFERFWKIGAEVTKFGASVASFFSSIYNTLAKTVVRIVGFGRGVRELSLAKVMFLPPFDLWSRQAPPPEEEHFPTEMGKANVSFLFNVMVARRTAAKLARRLATKIPRPTLLLERAHSEAEPWKETIEKAAEIMPRVAADLQGRFESKLGPSIKGIAEGFQEYSKKATFPALLLEMPKPIFIEPAEPEGPPHTLKALPEKEIPQVGTPEKPFPVVSQVPSRPPKETKAEPYPLVSVPVFGLRQEPARSFEYAGLTSIARAKTMFAFPPTSALKVEHPLPATKPRIGMVGPPVSIPFEGLRQEVVSSLQYVAKLPSIVLERAIPILKRMATFSVVSPLGRPLPSLSERQLSAVSQVRSLPTEEAKVEPQPLVSIPVMRLRPEAAMLFEYAAGLPNIILERAFPILETTDTFSPVLPLKPSSPSIWPSRRHPILTSPTPMRPSLVSRLLEEISPSLTSWIYGVSEILRGTTLSLSAVPIAASAAEKVVTEALVQPIPRFEAPKTLSTQETVSPVLTHSRPEKGVGRGEIEAFRLPAFVTSLIVALSQRYPLLLGEPTVSETYGTSFELTRVIPEETPALGRIPEEKSFSKLPTVIALAAAESLIAQRLHQEFGGLITQMQAARSSYGEKLSKLGAFRPIGAPVLSKLKAAAPRASWSPMIEPYATAISSAPRPLPRRELVSSPIQNTFNITISAESAEEDLRDFERKLSKILSEQVRRYYGSPRI